MAYPRCARDACAQRLRVGHARDHAATGSELCLPAAGGYAFEHRRIVEGDETRIGDHVLTAMATPGHTPEHLAWLVSDPSGAEPEAVFTGGNLMVGSAGRTDLVGADRTRELTEAQFDSVSRLASLPAGVGVFHTRRRELLRLGGRRDPALIDDRR